MQKKIKLKQNILERNHELFAKIVEQLSLNPDSACKPLIFQTMNSVRSYNLSLKHQRIGRQRLRKYEFVANL